jgi:uncharacterized SAM-binding protein YcdF (DUF218 family)
MDGKNLFFGPGLFVWLELAALLLLIFKPRRRKAAAGMQALSIIVLAVYMSPLPWVMLATGIRGDAKRLQEDLPVPDCTTAFPSLVVLGGGLYAPGVPTAETQKRLIRAGEILKESGEKGKNVFSAGGATLAGSDATEAEASEMFLERLLGPRSAAHRFFREDTSRNTHENAANTAALIKKLGLPKDIVLVTSEVHLPRAVAAFRAEGFRVCPAAPADQDTFRLISFDNGVRTFTLLNEWIGGIAYRLRGWG